MQEYTDEKLDELYRQYRELEFGSPLNALAAGIAEQAGGLSEAIGYEFELPAMEVVADWLTDWSKTQKPKDREENAYERAANFGGRTAVPLAGNWLLGKGTNMVMPTAVLSTFGSRMVGPLSTGHLLEDISEAGTIINNLRRQGYSGEELRNKANEAFTKEFAIGVLGALPAKLGKSIAMPSGRNAARPAAPKVLSNLLTNSKYSAPFGNEGLQNMLYDELTYPKEVNDE